MLLHGLCGVLGRFVDPGDAGEVGRFGPAVSEPCGVGGVGGVEGVLSLGAHLGGGAVVDRRRGVIADAGMTVVVVVVREECLAEGSGVGDRPEPLGEGRQYLSVLNWLSLKGLSLLTCGRL
jgi:hypothetical protein